MFALQVCNPDDNLHFLSNYLTELSLIDNNMLHFLPSEIAASAVYLSNLLLRRAPWSGTLQHYSYYTPQLLVRCVDSLANLHILVSQRSGQGELTAMTDKYAHGKYLSVSRSITPLPAHFVQAHLNTVANQGPAISVNSAYSST